MIPALKNIILHVIPGKGKRKIYFVGIFAAAMVLAGGFSAYRYFASPDFSQAADPGISHYTCPMHPQIHEDHPGQCPICHMDLVPVYRPGFGPDGAKNRENGSGEVSGNSSISTLSLDSGPTPGEVQISRERQALIGVRISRVEKKTLQGEIEAPGRIAFDPELAVAVREYIQVASRDPSLRRAAESRLRLLGMGEDEIRSLRHGDQAYRSLFLPEASRSAWVYATLYENETGWIEKGAKAFVEFPGSGEEPVEGVLRSLSPVVDAKTRSVTARIQIPARGRTFRPDTYVDVRILKKPLEGLVVPRSAILDTGTRQVAYLVLENNHFRPVEVRVGARDRDRVIVTRGLKEGDRVVSRAAFLIDSESRLVSPGFYTEEHSGETKGGSDHD